MEDAPCITVQFLRDDCSDFVLERVRGERWQTCMRWIAEALGNFGSRPRRNLALPRPAQGLLLRVVSGVAQGAADSIQGCSKKELGASLTTSGSLIASKSIGVIMAHQLAS